MAGRLQAFYQHVHMVRHQAVRGYFELMLLGGAQEFIHARANDRLVSEAGRAARRAERQEIPVESDIRESPNPAHSTRIHALDMTCRVPSGRDEQP